MNFIIIDQKGFVIRSIKRFQYAMPFTGGFGDNNTQVTMNGYFSEEFMDIIEPIAKYEGNFSEGITLMYAFLKNVEKMFYLHGDFSFLKNYVNGKLKNKIQQLENNNSLSLEAQQKRDELKQRLAKKCWI